MKQTNDLENKAVHPTIKGTPKEEAAKAPVGDPGFSPQKASAPAQAPEKKEGGKDA